MSVYIMFISIACTKTIMIDRIHFSVDSTDSVVLIYIIIHSDEYYWNSLLRILLGIMCKYGLYMSPITMCNPH